MRALRNLMKFSNSLICFLEATTGIDVPHTTPIKYQTLPQLRLLCWCFCWHLLIFLLPFWFRLPMRSIISRFKFNSKVEAMRYIVAVVVAMMACTHQPLPIFRPSFVYCPTNNGLIMSWFKSFLRTAAHTEDVGDVVRFTRQFILCVIVGRRYSLVLENCRRLQCDIDRVSHRSSRI